ncbi:hypothetical protein UPYG_G00285830 [Umbra pygmaea]|uniref:Uncharacterized protein n=1 Tax=Umbra pygmaea TaxID=75934 RepID=A0ABD0WQ64_UMBPY
MSETITGNSLDYFKVCLHRHGKDGWLDVKWKGATIKHTKQSYGFICGLFVLEIEWSTCWRWYHSACLGMTQK